MKMSQIILIALILASLSACNQTGSTSALDSFSANGTSRKVDSSALPQALKSVFSDPDSCRGLMSDGVVSMWAGYTDHQKNWGEIDADCSTSGDQILCKQNNNFLFSGQGSNMGMEIPKILELRSTAAYACLAAARAIGLQPKNDRSATHSLTATIEKVDGVTSNIASTSQSASEVYLITSVSTNRATDLRLIQKYFFTATGALFGLASRQEQKFNAETQVQTAEVHFPSDVTSALRKPTADGSL